MKPPVQRDDRCPVCGTAELTCGRETCQACSAVKLIRARNTHG